MRGGQLRSRTGLAPGEKEMQDKIDNLEITVFYLQKTVDDLNAVIVEQQKELRELGRMVKLLGKKLHEISVSRTEPSLDERPPHY